jgi:hypothetical protein
VPVTIFLHKQRKNRKISCSAHPQSALATGDLHSAKYMAEETPSTPGSGRSVILTMPWLESSSQSTVGRNLGLRLEW